MNNLNETIAQVKGEVLTPLDNVSSAISVIRHALTEQGIINDLASEPLFFGETSGATYEEILNSADKSILSVVKILEDFYSKTKNH
jgi:Na+/phosphate symporter